MTDEKPHGIKRTPAMAWGPKEEDHIYIICPCGLRVKLDKYVWALPVLRSSSWFRDGKHALARDFPLNLLANS